MIMADIAVQIPCEKGLPAGRSPAIRCRSRRHEAFVRKQKPALYDCLMQYCAQFPAHPAQPHPEYAESIRAFYEEQT